MRYHATVHDNKKGNSQVFECHVFADNSGLARVKVQEYLRAQDKNEEVLMQIALIEARDNIVSNLILIP